MTWTLLIPMATTRDVQRDGVTEENLGAETNKELIEEQENEYEEVIFVNFQI